MATGGSLVLYTDGVLPDVARFRQALLPADDMTLLVMLRRG